MADDRTLDILKSALLLEIRGREFYRKAADSADNAAVKEFFEHMVQEEESHVALLGEQFSLYKKNGALSGPPAQADMETVTRNVISDELKQQIAAAGFEAAAISAAMGMEERAIRLYSTRAEEAENPEEKELYRWLADWETRHLETLAQIDREVTEAVWNDNSFWPY